MNVCSMRRPLLVMLTEDILNVFFIHLFLWVLILVSALSHPVNFTLSESGLPPPLHFNDALFWGSVYVTIPSYILVLFNVEHSTPFFLSACVSCMILLLSYEWFPFFQSYYLKLYFVCINRRLTKEIFFDKSVHVCIFHGVNLVILVWI